MMMTYVSTVAASWINHSSSTEVKNGYQHSSVVLKTVIITVVPVALFSATYPPAFKRSFGLPRTSSISSLKKSKSFTVIKHLTVEVITIHSIQYKQEYCRVDIMKTLIWMYILQIHSKLWNKKGLLSWPTSAMRLLLSRLPALWRCDVNITHLNCSRSSISYIPNQIIWKNILAEF